MRDLDHHRRAVRVDVVGEFAEPANHLVLIEEDVAERLWAVRGDHRGAADHGQGDPAFRLLGMIETVPLLWHAVYGIRRLVRGRHKAVAKDKMLEPEEPPQRS